MKGQEAEYADKIVTRVLAMTNAIKYETCTKFNLIAIGQERHEKVISSCVRPPEIHYINKVLH